MSHRAGAHSVFEENNMEKNITYRAVHSNVSIPDMPAHVIKQFYDEQDRRCTRIIATCGAFGEDNDANADFIANAFNNKEK